MKEESILLLSDLQILINQVVLIDYTIIILGSDCMPAQTRQGDNNTGHDACPPSALSGGSSNVFVNGKY